MYEDTYLGTADSAVRLVEEIGMANVGLNPTSEILYACTDRSSPGRNSCRKLSRMPTIWHVKNYSRDEDRARGAYVAVPAPMESGLISYRAAFRTAISAGFQGVVCTEHYGGDGLSVCATNQAYLREKILPKNDKYLLGVSLVTQQRRAPAHAKEEG